MASWTGTPCSFPPCVSFIAFWSTVLVLSCGHSLSNRPQCHHHNLGCQPALYCFEHPLPYHATTAVPVAVCAVHRLVVRWFHRTHPTWRFLPSVLANSTPRSNGEPVRSSTEWMQRMVSMRVQCHGTMRFYLCRHYPQWWTHGHSASAHSNNAIASVHYHYPECILRKLDALIIIMWRDHPDCWLQCIV